MKPGIAISRKWFDEDVLHLTFQVCDGISLFSSEAYTELDWGTRAAKGLSEFARQIHGGLYNLEAGDGGPEYGSGAFRARFHWFKTAPAHDLNEPAGRFHCVQGYASGE